jgi:transcriptional regulator with XRE-family HTH domain
MAATPERGYDRDVTNQFPRSLHRSRKARRLSQLELAVRAGTTQRHLSFIEQGRLRPRVRAPDPSLELLLIELERDLPPLPTEPDVLGLAVPLELESSGGHLRLITTLTSFATATDITLAELHLEAFLPADEATADVLRKRAERW